LNLAEALLALWSRGDDWDMIAGGLPSALFPVGVLDLLSVGVGVLLDLDSVIDRDRIFTLELKSFMTGLNPPISAYSKGLAPLAFAR
jgi:hypothetical protein